MSPCAIAHSSTGSREFAVSPLLVAKLDTSQYIRRRAYLAGDGAPVTPNIREVRMNRLLDSCISGAFTGAILHSIMRESLCSLNESTCNRP